MATLTVETRSQTEKLASNKTEAVQTETVQIECVVCTETKDFLHFPLSKLSTDCQHAMRVCVECVRLSITADLKNKYWQDINCPECNNRLDADVVLRYASPETRAKYEDFLTKHMLESQEGFRWCTEPSCGSGHIHEGGYSQPIMKCPNGHLSCYVHKVPWHKGMTCDEFDIVKKNPDSPAYKQHLRQQEENKQSEKIIALTSKPCPSCGRHIEKDGGCAHMIYTFHMCPQLNMYRKDKLLFLVPRTL
ncbi:uncharacterized protein B0T23DRAFT_323735 [Neurospora hispaniola]|uniref:RBR-type E3 ubiquitin transferase n=1 Tax=Neurospora hispaniola TaxID=588809 RepID=A0AAJ0I2Q2_9PEZI|nr:hypothetical protein B0T23DRAFT_323735 [Neurospora hispaniola]